MSESAPPQAEPDQAALDQAELAQPAQFRPEPFLSAQFQPILELRVLNGLHRGATLPLDGDTASLGSDESNDIVLLDPGIAAQHGRVQRKPQAPESADLADPAAAPWELHDHAGGVTPLLLGQPAALGPLRIVLANEGAPWEPWLDPSREPAAAPAAETVSPPAPPRAALPLIAVWGGAGVTGIVAGLLTLASLYDIAPPKAPAPPPIVAALPPAPVLVYPPAPKPAQQFAAPPFSLASVTESFVVTPEGERLLPGDSYQGYKLVAIEPHSGLFSNANGDVAALSW